MFHRSIHERLGTSTNTPTLSTANHAHTKHPLYSMSHFLDGVYRTGGTPLVDLVECLGVEGTLD